MDFFNHNPPLVKYLPFKTGLNPIDLVIRLELTYPKDYWVVTVITEQGNRATIKEHGQTKQFYKLGDASLYLYDNGIYTFEVSEFELIRGKE